MIENIIIKSLLADSELNTLTSGHIYPNVAQVKELPCVVMTSDEPTNPTNDPFYYTQNLTFEIYNKKASLKGEFINGKPVVTYAINLVLKLEEFKPMIKSSAQARQVYTICRYVQELASEFHSFYNSTRVITEDLEVTKSRLVLVWAFKTVLANALNILAVSAPERM